MNKYNKIKTDKIINFITIIVFITLSFYSFKYCILSNKFSIDKIIISGNNFITNDSIEKIVKENIYNKNIFNTNIKLINKQIIDNKFIESSKIFIQFPSTISIVIDEINPIALFEKNNQFILIDDKHKMINASINSINYYSLPIVSIKNYNDKDIYRTINILEYITQVDKNLYDSIQEIIIKEEFSYIVINNNTKIKLDKNNIESNTYKLVQFINDIQNLNDINSYKYVNVSIPNQIIVKERKI